MGQNVHNHERIFLTSYFATGFQRRCVTPLGQRSQTQPHLWRTYARIATKADPENAKSTTSNPTFD